MTFKAVPKEETLDPSDWNELRQLAHCMVDDIFSYIEKVRDRPVWQPVPDQVREFLRSPLPLQGQPAEAVFEEFRVNILPYPLGNIHPRFWGWVIGTGTPVGMMTEMLAAALNPNLGGADHVANLVEQQVIDWCKQMLGYPAEASGLLVSGGSMANLIGLAVARSSKAGFNVRSAGVKGSKRPLTLYGSLEMHSSLDKAVELLGLGNSFLRHIPVDDDYRIDVAALRRAIKTDLSSGLQPICVIGNAGTVNTGAIDPLDKLAEIAAEFNLWYHVDGAFGALAYLSPTLRQRLEGMEKADSLAFDLHKWLHVPIEAGCVLVRDADAHRRTFAPQTEYLKHQARGAGGGDNWYSEYGIELTRGFKALKVWMAMKNYGINKLGRLVQQNVDQASYLAKLIKNSPNLELLAPVPLNIVCFRFIAPGMNEGQLNRFNEELLIRLQESGVAVPSSTTLGGRYAIRCAITNHRSRREDFEILVSEVERIGKKLIAEGWTQREKKS